MLVTFTLSCSSVISGSRLLKLMILSQNWKHRALFSEVHVHNSEVHAQNSEIHAQNSEVHAQNSEVRVQNSEVHAQNSEVRVQNSKRQKIKAIAPFN